MPTVTTTHDRFLRRAIAALDKYPMELRIARRLQRQGLSTHQLAVVLHDLPGVSAALKMRLQSSFHELQRGRFSAHALAELDQLVAQLPEAD